MSRRPAVLVASDPEAVSAAATALAAGHIVGMPTETVYGLAVLPLPEPLAALIAAKRRPPEKGIALLIDDLEQVSSLVVVPRAARALANRFWPGPLTIVVDLREDIALPDALTGGTARIGIRVPDHRVPRALARLLGPLAVTSANLSGRPEATTADELIRSVGSALAVVIDDGSSADGGVPSTVVSVAREGSLSVLRAGAIDLAALEAAVREAS